MQNSNLKNELLGQHSAVSAEEMERYLSGELSAREARAVELKLNADEFSQAATEGFETYGSEVNIAEVNSAWRSKRSNTALYTTLAIVALSAIGLFLYNTQEIIEPVVSDVTKIAEPAVEKNEQKTKEESTIQIEVKQEEKENTQVSATPKVEEIKEVTPEKNEEIAPVLFSQEMEKEIFTISPLEAKEGEMALKHQIKTLKSPSVRIRHYRNYKLVDQGIGLDQSMLKPILDGSPASSETIVVNPRFPDWVPADSVYRVSINEALNWIIDADYKSAKMRLERLVENEPNDLSAAFYLGYTLYLKGEFAEAILYFNKAESHLIQTFDHDARFLEIKSLLQLGRGEEAKKEAAYLKSANSFYADKAVELVD